MFTRFPSLSRFSQGWSITEKIDGTNSQIIIDNLASADDAVYRNTSVAEVDGEFIFAGSRSRLITPDNDNMGFAKWVKKNAEMLVATLGPGRHFGEWWGAGIQRGYGIKEKRFSLFNALRWKQEELPEELYVVPAFHTNVYADNPGDLAHQCLNQLRIEGSIAVPGFMDPEGIVMFHRASGTSFKKTFDYDEYGKWMENQEKKAV